MSRPSVFERALMNANEHYLHASPCHRAKLDWQGEGVLPRCLACGRACSEFLVLRRGGGLRETVEKRVPIRLSFGALPGRRVVNRAALLSDAQRKRRPR